MGKKLIFGIVAAIIILIAAVAVFKAPPSQGASAAKLCQQQGARVYKCEGGAYLVAPAMADVGVKYEDAGGNLLAYCNGFINKQQSQACIRYSNYSCDRSHDLCATANK